MENVAVQTLFGAAAVVTALGIIVRQAVLPVIRWARRAEKAWAYVEQELTHNSGSTTRDAIKRLEDWTKRTDERFEQFDKRVAAVEGYVSKPVALVQPLGAVISVDAEPVPESLEGTPHATVHP